MKLMTKSLTTALVLSLFATACFDGSGSDTGSAPEGGGELAFVDESDDDAVSPDPDPVPATDDTDAAVVDPVDPVTSSEQPETADEDRPCDGGAFPDDDDFHQLLCDVQWAQVDLLGAGVQLDSAWVSGATDAMMLYGSDRDAAVAGLEAVIAEMSAAMPAQEPVSDDEVTVGDAQAVSEAMGAAQDCMIEVTELMVEVAGSGDFDPVEVSGWATAANEAAALAESGDFAAAEELVCEVRDEVAAAVETMG